MVEIMPIRSKAIKSNEGANVLHHSLCAFVKSLKKKPIYINVYCHTTKQKVFQKNKNKEKINNYTYISHTSEWRFSPVTVTGLNSFRGKIFCRLSSLIVRISPSISMKLLQNTFYVHDRN